MLEGLVQHDCPLTINGILGRMRTVNGQSKVITLRAPGKKTEVTYSELAARADRVAAALSNELGIRPGSGRARAGEPQPTATTA